MLTPLIFPWFDPNVFGWNLQPSLMKCGESTHLFFVFLPFLTLKSSFRQFYPPKFVQQEKLRNPFPIVQKSSISIFPNGFDLWSMFHGFLVKSPALAAGGMSSTPGGLSTTDSEGAAEPRQMPRMEKWSASETRRSGRGGSHLNPSFPGYKYIDMWDATYK